MWYLTPNGEVVNLTKCLQLNILNARDDEYRVYAEPIKPTSTICLTEKFITIEEAKDFIEWLIKQIISETKVITWKEYKHTIIDKNLFTSTVRIEGSWWRKLDEDNI